MAFPTFPTDGQEYNGHRFNLTVGAWEKIPEPHNHDDRYYEDHETDTLLDSKAGIAHTHDSRYYTKAQSVPAAGGIFTGDVEIGGDLLVTGTTSSINTTNTNILDNIITINSGFTGVPPTSLKSGIEVERGDAANYRIIFDEADDAFKMGEVGNESNIATQTWANASYVPKSGGTITGNLEISHTHAQLKLTDNTYSNHFWVVDHQNGDLNFSYDNTEVALTLTEEGNVESLGTITGDKVYNAVWNDIVDFIDTKENIEVQFGRVYRRAVGGKHEVASEYMQSGLLGLASDTYGFGVGHKADITTTQLPIAIGGIVLAYVDKEYESGTALTSAADGGLTELLMEDKRNYPERILATYYRPEEEAQWNGIAVDGRHWVKIK